MCVCVCVFEYSPATNKSLKPFIALPLFYNNTSKNYLVKARFHVRKCSAATVHLYGVTKCKIMCLPL